jgi:membrane protein DedA with SNARE-associated domain
MSDLVLMRPVGEGAWRLRHRAAAGVAVIVVLALTALVPSEALATIVVIAATTFISEDLTCIATGLLIQRGELHPVAGVAGCFAGILAGDVLLWLIGRGLWTTVGRWGWVSRRVPAAKVARLGRWLDDHLAGAVLTSRFLPGSRLPMFLAAGALNRDTRRFFGWVVVAAILWTPLLVLLAASLGPAFIVPLERVPVLAGWAIPATAAVVFMLLRFLLPLGTGMGRAALLARVSRLWKWEYWPTWLFYAPLVPWILWLSVRHRGFTTITAANPGIPHGGFVGESKGAILRALPARHVAAFVLIPAGNGTARVQRLTEAVARNVLQFPLILKPDAGQRGVGVRLIADLAAARDYLAAHPREVVAQAYHPGPFEAGIFYCRIPGQPRGWIFSVTEKQFPVITGDGASTVEELIWRHPRFRMQADIFLARHDAQRHRVLARGETLRLGVAGNHCQGTMFTDGSRLITPLLEEKIDTIARAFEGFYFGRFDVRFGDVEAFMEGRDLTIIELNGVTSESTNIYDPSRSLVSAWWTLARQWALLFRIGALNRGRGCRASGMIALARAVIGHYRGRSVPLMSD